LTPGGPAWLPLHPHNVPLQAWLELGAPGAILLALVIARLWLGLPARPWPRLYAAAVAGSLAAALAVALGSYGMWQEWWLGTEFLTAFLILVMGRLVEPSNLSAPPRGT
jgi:O-antigen ligase